jgi:Metallopeptidase toxin 3
VFQITVNDGVFRHALHHERRALFAPKRAERAMQINTSDQTFFPKLAEYVRYKLPTLLTDDAKGQHTYIRWAMKTFGRMDIKEVTDSLTWGSGPSIVVVDTDGFLNLGDAQFDSTDENFVMEGDVAALEQGRADAFQKNRHGAKFLSVGRLLLVNTVASFAAVKSGVASADGRRKIGLNAMSLFLKHAYPAR